MPKEFFNEKYFHFLKNQLFMVHVFGGIYSGRKLHLLKKDIEKNYGIYSIEDNHWTIERWLIAYSENNETVFSIDIEDHSVYCSYMYLKLMKEYNKNPKWRDEYEENIIIDEKNMN